MGKGKRTTEAPPKEPTPATAAATAMLEESRELLAKPPRTSIHRIDPDTGERKFCGKVTTDLATEEFVQKRFGPGKYGLTHQAVGSKGTYEYAGSDTIIIAEWPEGHDPAAAGGESDDTPAAGASSPAVATGGNVLERAMEAGVLRLLEASSRQSDLTLAMVERMTKPRETTGPTVLEMITAATPVILALINRQNPDPTKTAIELATLLSKDKGGGFEAMTAALERGMKLGERFASASGGDGGSLMPVIGQGIQMLGGIVDQIVAERRAARGDPVAVVSSPSAPAAAVPERSLHLVGSESSETMPSSIPGAPAAAQPGDRLWLAFCRPQLPRLIQASTFIPPGAAAETIASNLTPAALADLLNDIEDQTAPGFVGRLAAVFPQLEQVNQQWFAEMIRELLELTTDTDEPEAPAPATKGAKPANAGKVK